MKDTVRWSVIVSRETDLSLRMFLAQQGMRKGDLSKFVEEAVQWRVLDRAVSETKAKNANVSARDLDAAIQEAVAAVRADRFKRSV
jgi:hypothetical protein